MESEVRRSERISKENAGFKRNSCSSSKCLPCNAIPPLQSKTVVKNLTKSFCKVAKDELEDKLSKKQKKKQGMEELAKVSLARGKEDTTPSAQ